MLIIKLIYYILQLVKFLPQFFFSGFAVAEFDGWVTKQALVLQDVQTNTNLNEALTIWCKLIIIRNSHFSSWQKHHTQFQFWLYGNQTSPSFFLSKREGPCCCFVRCKKGTHLYAHKLLLTMKFPVGWSWFWQFHSLQLS